MSFVDHGERTGEQLAPVRDDLRQPTSRASRRCRRIGLAATLLGALLVPGCGHSLGRLLADSGYCELRPPTTLLSPGTVVVMRRKDPLVVDIVCTAGEALGDGFEPLTSPSADVTDRLRRGQTFRLDTGAVAQIRGAAELRLVKRVELRLRDVRVLSLSDASVLRRSEQRDPACRQAIEAARAAGAEVAMIREVIQASVEYSVHFEASAGLDAAARLRLVQEMAPALGADVSTATESRVEGKALFWGAVEDMRLMGPGVVDGSSGRFVGPVPMQISATR